MITLIAPLTNPLLPHLYTKATTGAIPQDYPACRKNPEMNHFGVKIGVFKKPMNGIKPNER
ncbi:MAG: hypothetical protein WCK53_02770, partial [Methanomicrobiales archaeon]